MSASISRQLAEFAASVRWQSIPESVQADVPLRVLDTVGLITLGSNTPAVQSATAFGTPYGVSSSSLKSTMIGSRAGMPASIAALVHGVAAHCRDFDDTFMDSIVHPGSVVVPVALAVAEAVNATPEDFGAAIIAGYEIAARIGGAAGKKFHQHFLHPTGQVGPLAAAAVAGRLMGLSAEEISSAMGLAASMSSGIMAFLVDGGWSKWLHAGWAAHGGIVAASMVKAGFKGPQFAIEGPRGLYGALLHGETIDIEGITRRLGAEWQGAQSKFKYYPCAHVIHPHIDATLHLMDEFNICADDVDRIEARLAPWAIPIVGEPREARLTFDTELQAIASLPYQVAVAVLDGEVTLAALAAEERSRKDIRAMAERIFTVADDSFADFDGTLTIFAKGARFSMEVATPGSDTQRLSEKFASNVQPMLDRINPECATTNIIPGVEADALTVAAQVLHGGWEVASGVLASVSVS
jgi:2-methylcitrate dehydratase PrpD